MSIKETSGRLSLKMRCAECLHFKTGPKSPQFKGKCSDLGRQGYAKACSSFTPDFTILNKKSGSLDNAAVIANLTKTFTPAQLKVLGFLLTKETNEFSKMGLRFGQPMYLYLEPTVGLGRAAMEQLHGEDLHYLDRYFKAYVTGVNDNGDGNKEIFLASSVEGKPDYYVSVNMKTGEKAKVLLTRSEYKERAEALKAAGKVTTPKKLRKLLSKLLDMKIEERQETDQVPTIDTVPYEWFVTSSHHSNNDKVKLHTRKKKKHMDGLPSVTPLTKLKKKGKTKVMSLGGKKAKG